MMKLRLMLADDNAMYREGLCMFLELAPNMEVIAEVADGRGVLHEFAQSRPDVVLMDISMPNLSGIDATRQLLAIDPKARVIGLSGHVDLSQVAAMIDAGALGYVIKGSAGKELCSAILRVSRNQHYFDPAIGIKDLADLTPYMNHTAAL